MTIDTDQTIETGRSWKDLPPEPPFGDPLEASVITAPLPPVEDPEAPSRWSWRTAAAILLLLLVALVLWLLLPRSDDPAPVPTTVPATESTEPAPTETTDAPQNPQPAPPAAGSAEEPVADVAAALLPSVVQIETGFGVGSGFVYDDAGLIFTAAHVVTGAEEVGITLTDGRETTGTVVARDLDRDVAVVATTAPDLVAAQLAGDEEIRIGQQAIAVGSPFGLEQSVTVGVVSGLDRSLDVGGRSITGLIQTDAAINVGNSGGPLADASGRVIGINVAIATASGGSDGVGFAVPIDVALGVAEGITPDSPPAPVDNPNPLGPLGLDPLGGLPDLFGPDSGLGDLDSMLDLFGGLGLLPDGFEDFMDDLERLGQDLDQLGSGGLDPFNLDPFNLDGFGGGAPGDALFDLGDLPPGYQQAGSQLTATDGVTTQVETISGPDGTVTVRATAGIESGQSLESAGGEIATVRGQLGKLEVTGTRVVVSWVEQGAFFEAMAPAAVGSAALLDIVEAMEVG